MKLLSKLSVIILCIILSGCNHSNQKETKIVPNSPLSNNQKDYDRLINGIWAENENDNALFSIKSDTLYYIEHQDKPLRYFISGDTLCIKDDPEIIWIIVQLTTDSLLITNEYLPDTIRLYRR